MAKTDKVCITEQASLAVEVIRKILSHLATRNEFRDLGNIWLRWDIDLNPLKRSRGPYIKDFKRRMIERHIGFNIVINGHIGVVALCLLESRLGETWGLTKAWTNGRVNLRLTQTGYPMQHASLPQNEFEFLWEAECENGIINIKPKCLPCV